MLCDLERQNWRTGAEIGTARLFGTREIDCSLAVTMADFSIPRAAFVQDLNRACSEVGLKSGRNYHLDDYEKNETDDLKSHEQALPCGSVSGSGLEITLRHFAPACAETAREATPRYCSIRAVSKLHVHGYQRGIRSRSVVSCWAALNGLLNCERFLDCLETLRQA
jgi:hypothetical protein